MAIKQDSNTFLDGNQDPIVQQTDIALATANGGIIVYQTTKDIYVTAVRQQFNTARITNVVNDIAGGNGEIQFYQDGKFASDKDFRYDPSTDTLVIGGELTTAGLNLTSASNISIGGGSPGFVLSTNGAGDLSWISQVAATTINAANVTFAPANTVSATNVQGAIAELGSSKLATSGGTLTGPLLLSANPTTGFGAATKSYVDSLVSSSTTLVAAANNSSFAGNITVNAQPNITSVGTLTSLTVSGLITGNGGGLSNIPGANVTGQVGFAAVANSVAGANVIGNVTSAITANFANFAGNVTFAAQPNITSLGTLTSLTVSGLITGNGGGLSNIPGANITGAVAFATTANSVAGANVIGNVTSAITANFANFAGNVTVAAQPNITSVGTLTSLAVTGAVTGASFTGSHIGAGNNLSNIQGANVSGEVNFAAVANSVAGANVSGEVDFAATANAVAGANVIGNVTSAITANFANFAGNVTVAAQPNITSVGTLTSLAVSGAVTATSFTGDHIGTGNNLSNIQGANVSGAVAFATVANSVAGANVTGAVTLAALANAVVGANVIGNVTSAITANFANFAGNVIEASQPNITSVGTLTSLTVSGNTTSGNLVTGGVVSATGTVTGGNISTAGNVVASGTVTGGNISTAGNVTATGSVVATGNVTGGNISTAGNVTATGDVQADNQFIGNAITTRTGPLTLTATGTNDITLAVGTGNVNLPTSTYITNVKDPVSAQDAATKNYVDALAQGLKPKASVQCATTAAITLAPAPAAIDGHTLVTGDRVLVKNQAVAAQNGIYAFNGTALVRATDADTASDLPDGTFVFIESGTTYSASAFTLVSVVTTLDTDPITFVQFSTGGTYTAGSGLTLSGSQFSVSPTGVTVGSYGNATHVPSFTVDAKGQLTVASTAAVIANAETLAGTTLKSTVVNSSLTSVGTLTGLTSGGTVNFTTATNIGLGAVGNVNITGGTNGQVLKTNGSGVLSWTTVSSDKIANGTSDVTIDGLNGNITANVAGSLRMNVTSSYTNFTHPFNINTAAGENMLQTNDGGGGPKTVYIGQGVPTSLTIADFGGQGGGLLVSGSSQLQDVGVMGDLEVVGAYTTGTSSTGASNVIDCSLSNYFIKSFTAATTISFTNVPPAGTCYSCTIQITLGASGAATFPAAVRWQFGSTPAFAVSRTHLVMLITTDGGTTWYATAVTDFA